MKKTDILWFLIPALALFLCTAVYAEGQKWCPLCSMNLKMFRKTNQWLTFSDGKKIGYCSLHCAAKVYKERASDIDRWEVVDYHTMILIDAHGAHFLIGSDLPGTMTPVSKLAFASLDAARNYQAEHGGTLGTLEDALKRALSGMGEDMAMIKKKVTKMSAMGKKLAAKHGCYNCHGQGGTGGTAISWNTQEFSKKMNNRVKIKEAIMKGSHNMKGYKGKVTEKDLHAITIYLWTLRPR